ncbi:MAG: ATP cone domain-containing protein [Candidatus Eiseniibacteriota bacterium]
MAPGISAIVKRNGEIVPFHREKITVAIYKAAAAIGGHDRPLSERLSAQVVEALEATYDDDTPPTVEEIQDVVERVLIKNGHAKTAKTYILYRHERARMRDERRTGRIENIPYKAMWQSLDWAVAHGCETVQKLNAVMREGRLPGLIADADARYEGILDAAAAAIRERGQSLRFIIVAGPSSSGKTTTTLKLSERLGAHGIPVIPLALDNYFFDLELHPQDEHGDHDFETPEAMDLQLVNHHLAELDAGRGIDVPKYDFKAGRRTSVTTRFDPKPGTLVLLDTLHGLYPGLTESVPAEHKFKVYIETIGQMKDANGRYIRWTDVRMLRRMIRDSQHRGYSPESTILHWHYVRRSELKHIIPFQGMADFLVDSGLAYELPFLKLHLFARFADFIKKWANDERRLDGWIRAKRVDELLSSIADVKDDSAVPARSLLREFIGGSAYDVH